jgi:hypothetical protein
METRWDPMFSAIVASASAIIVSYLLGCSRSPFFE